MRVISYDEGVGIEWLCMVGGVLDVRDHRIDLFYGWARL